MVAVVVPIIRFCSYGGCADVGTKWVLDSQNRQWGGGYCDDHAEAVRDHINDTEQWVLLQRTSLIELLPSTDRSA